MIDVKPLFQTGALARDVAAWVGQHIPGCGRGWDEAVALTAVRPDGSINAAFVFHDWSPEYRVIAVSGYAPRPWATPEMVAALHRYPFDDAGAQAVVMQIPEGNTRAARVAKRLGFTPHRVPRLCGRDQALIAWVLGEEERLH